MKLLTADRTGVPHKEEGKQAAVNWPIFFVFLLTLLPLANLIYVLIRNAVDVPYWDQWDFVPVLEKSYSGNLKWPDIWGQYHEHRLLFPLLIMLGLAHLTDWNIRYELEINVVLAGGMFGLLIWQLRATARKLQLTTWKWLAPACSLLVFSIGHFQNWLWGWQIQMMLNVLAVMAGLVVLASGDFRWGKLGISAALGIVASFSFANGLAFWPIAGAVLFVQLQGRPERAKAFAAWTTVALLVYGAYFWDYHRPPEHPPPQLALNRPVEFVKYVLIYAGGICAQYFRCEFSDACRLGLCCGLGGIAGSTFAVCFCLRHQMADLRTLLPYVGLSAYSLSGALITGMGRVGFGSSQALSSRYCVMMLPMWASLVMLLFFLAQLQPQARPRSGLRVAGFSSPDIRVGARWALAIVLSLLVISSLEATYGARVMSQVQLRGRNRLLQLAEQPWTRNEDGGLSALYLKPSTVVERYPVLLERHLSAFAEVR